MHIDCTDCGARVLAEDVDLPSAMAKCRACNAVFPLGKASSSARALDRHIPAPRPEGLQVFDDAREPGEPGYRDTPRASGTLRIVRRWYELKFVALLFFCIAWDSFLVVWYASALGGGGGFALLAVVFPVAHVAVGVGLSYYTLAGFLNRTTFTLDASHVSIRHAPLPWKGNRRIPREEIVNLYCEEVVTETKNGPSSTIWLSAVVSGNVRVRLAAMPVDQAKYIEEQIEGRLGISDRPVAGEVGG